MKLRELNARKLGPGDYYAEYSLLTGAENQATFTALTPGILLELERRTTQADSYSAT